MNRPIYWLFMALTPLLLLASCIVTPGKFASTLDIRTDRSFTFTYVGEVVLARTKPADDSADDSLDGDDQSFDGDGEPHLFKLATPGKALPKSGARAKPAPPQPDEDFSDTPEEVVQLNALAEALSKEYGFRSARYIGHRRLAIDYAISGRLDHAFLFPFNPDGNAVLPFIAIELRGKDRVRIKAPGYANEQSMTTALGGMGGASALGGGDDAANALDGTFTLTTNGSVVSQNQEDGVQTLPGGASKIVWRATPSSKDAPMAVLRLDPLP